MTPGQKLPPNRTAVAASPPPDPLPDVSIFEEFLQGEPFRQLDPQWRRFSPLVSWLIVTGRPAVTVELGPGDRASLLSTCGAVHEIGAGARCLVVRLPVPAATATSDADGFHQVLTECTDRFGNTVTGYDDETESLTALAAGPEVGLLHLSLFDLDDVPLPDLAPWFDVMAPGAVVVVTSTAADVSSGFAKAKQLVSARYPSSCISLGLTTEAVVAQVPVDGAVPTVELLQNVPSAVGRLLTLFGEPVETYEHSGDESVSPLAVRAIVANLIERQHTEREAFLSALRAYKDLTARLTIDVAEARSELAAQVEFARVEREHLVSEFLDRVDVLSAKISTSASRYAAQLVEKDRQLEEQEQRLLAHAGQAATAQSIIDDILTSSSWRFTAPIRLMSRVVSRRSRPSPDDSDS